MPNMNHGLKSTKPSCLTTTSPKNPPKRMFLDWVYIKSIEFDITVHKITKIVNLKFTKVNMVSKYLIFLQVLSNRITYHMYHTIKISPL